VISSALAEKCLRRKSPHFRARLVMDAPGWTGTACLLWRGEGTAAALPPARTMSGFLALERLPAAIVGTAFVESERTSCLLVESDIGITALDENFAPVFDGLEVSVSDTVPVMIFGCRDGQPVVIASEYWL
jgi:hypothetical protein